MTHFTNFIMIRLTTRTLQLPVRGKCSVFFCWCAFIYAGITIKMRKDEGKMVKGIRKQAYGCEKYVSGKSMDEVMREYGLQKVIKLGSNENQYGPYENAKKAMEEEIALLNIYPERNYIHLKELLAEKFGVGSDWISLRHGAGNVLDSIAKTLLEDGDEVIVPQQSYRLYREISKIMGAKVVEVSLTDKYEIDMKDFAKALSDKTKIVWLCNPNNPTGSVVPKEDIDWFVDQLPENCWLIIDEAYAEFADQELLPDTVKYIKEGKNVIGIRTFSKYYGLAGGRIGYLIANPELVNWYDTVSEPFNANRIGLAGACALLEKDQENCKKYCEIMKADREMMNKKLTEMGCECYPSQANFVFFSTPYNADDVAELLLRKGIIVRPCGGWGYDKHIRISIGTTEQNKEVLKELEEAFRTLSEKEGE